MYTSATHACIGIGKPDKVLDYESERNINQLQATTI